MIKLTEEEKPLSNNELEIFFAECNELLESADDLVEELLLMIAQ